MSLLCICIVFVPMFFLQGVARFLFVPMAEAVMFAMVCSFVLSRTLVPTMSKYLLRPHAPHTGRRVRDARRRRATRWCGFQRRFEARFERVREGYRGAAARRRCAGRWRVRGRLHGVGRCCRSR